MLALSGIQHFSFCRRQWALIHMEGLWRENVRTVQGALLHDRAHDVTQRERRGDCLTLRGLSVFSRTLGLFGKCDVVEFHADPSGVPLRGEQGLWRPITVEYNMGSPKENDSDRLQLCAQAICLEEMLCCEVAQGAVFYAEIRRREEVCFEQALRERVGQLCREMHALFQRGSTPLATPSKSCNACSLAELCLPKLRKVPSVADYIREHVGEEAVE